MTASTAKRKLAKSRISSVARVIACATFLLLAIIGVSSLVRAMTLEAIANEGGIPTVWDVASLGNAKNITVPITYWDQRQDPCGAANRQFEWTECRIYASTAQQGIVLDTLGPDSLPIPAHETTASARAAGINELSENVTGHNPVQKGDNFYMWFHETDRSLQVDDSVTFERIGNNVFKYGGANIFPLDGIDFSKGDISTNGHNFHFTAHLQFAIKVAASGKEKFEFTGDDDVWVFLNNKLVLDIGGLHTALNGWFIINEDGTLTTYVETAGEKTIDIGLSKNDIVNLDFFYAERSTSESNVNITISNMIWPISADSTVDGTVVGKVAGTEKKMIEFISSITNRDPSHKIVIERLAAFLTEDPTDEDTEGFLPLDVTTLYYTATPDDPKSWKPVDITAPSNSKDGFNLAEPLILEKSHSDGDTLYFRFFTTSSEYTGTTSATVSYYTTRFGQTGTTFASVTYASDEVEYTGKNPDDDEDEGNGGDEGGEGGETDPSDPGDPDDPNGGENGDDNKDDTGDDEDDENKTPELPIPSNPNTPSQPSTPETPSEPEPSIPEIPVLPGTDLGYLDPLGEFAFVPNTGVVIEALASVFEQGFAETVLSQGFVMVVLFVFALAFATWFSFRKYATSAATSASSRKKYPKMPAKGDLKSSKTRGKKATKSAMKTKRTTSRTRK